MPQERTTVCRYASPLGPMLLAAEGGALSGAWFEGQRFFPGALAALPDDPEEPVLREARAWLDAFFAGAQPGETPPLAPRGTAFQKAVWAALTAIPYGETRSYGALAAALAETLGRRVSARAVGGAVGRNPLSVFVPCHRVVGADGSLTGYAGGLPRKEALLRLEAAGRAPRPPHP